MEDVRNVDGIVPIVAVSRCGLFIAYWNGECVNLQENDGHTTIIFPTFCDALVFSQDSTVLFVKGNYANMRTQIRCFNISTKSLINTHVIDHNIVVEIKLSRNTGKMLLIGSDGMGKVKSCEDFTREGWDGRTIDFQVVDPPSIFSFDDYHLLTIGNSEARPASYYIKKITVGTRLKVGKTADFDSSFTDIISADSECIYGLDALSTLHKFCAKTMNKLESYDISGMHPSPIAKFSHLHANTFIILDAQRSIRILDIVENTTKQITDHADTYVVSPTAEKLYVTSKTHFYPLRILQIAGVDVESLFGDIKNAAFT